ncbi:MAG: hypothetical protein U0172_02040 [Nitrospiraceae bacterium]
MPRTNIRRRFVRASMLLGIALGLGLFLSADHASAHEALWDVLPIKPINLDIAIRRQTFAPRDREIGIQAGFTALRYGNLEVRTMYQFFSIRTQEFTTDQHSILVNPRWNNFIDLFDFPKARPINRMIRHALFGPLEDRAVPYVGGIAGVVLPSSGNDDPGHVLGGQLGVRFPVAHGIAVDFGFQYTQYRIDFREVRGLAHQWMFLSGVRF